MVVVKKTEKKKKEKLKMQKGRELRFWKLGGMWRRRCGGGGERESRSLYILEFLKAIKERGGGGKL